MMKKISILILVLFTFLNSNSQSDLSGQEIVNRMQHVLDSIGQFETDNAFSSNYVLEYFPKKNILIVHIEPLGSTKFTKDVIPLHSLDTTDIELGIMVDVKGPDNNQSEDPVIQELYIEIAYLSKENITGLEDMVKLGSWGNSSHFPAIEELYRLLLEFSAVAKLETNIVGHSGGEMDVLLIVEDDDEDHSFNQEVVEDIGEKEEIGEVFTSVEEMPLFGRAENTEESNNNLYSYILSRTNPITTQTQGVVYVYFVVSKTGKVSDVEVVRSAGDELDALALKIVKEMKDWKPGTVGGENVRVQFQVPIQFKNY